MIRRKLSEQFFLKFLFTELEKKSVVNVEEEILKATLESLFSQRRIIFKSLILEYLIILGSALYLILQ